MASSRILFAATGITAVAASFLMLAAPAAAATADVTYVNAADIGPDPGLSENLPEGFLAAPAFLNGPSAVSFSTAGLLLPADTNLYYLYTAGDTRDVATGLTVGSLNHGDGVDASVNFALQAADSSYLALYTEGPAHDDADTSAVWTLADGVGVTILASQTLAEIRGYLAVNWPAAQILAFGVQASSGTTFSDLSFSGKQYIFTPEPVVTAAPTTLSASALVNVGTTITTNGFLPNEVVEQYISAPDGNGGPVGQFTADADGVVTATYRGTGSMPVGDYSLTLVGSVPNPQSFRFTVTADVAVAAPLDSTRPLAASVDSTPSLAAPVDSTRSLAATGADAARPLGLAGALLALGLVLTLGPVRRRWRRSA